MVVAGYGTKFPGVAVSGSHEKGCRIYGGSFGSGPSPGKTQRISLYEGGDRLGKKGGPNRRNVELSTALIVSRSGPMV